MDIQNRIKKSLIVKKQIKELFFLQKRLSTCFSEQEVKLLCGMLEYKHILKKKISAFEKKMLLADTLLQCSASSERLTNMLNDIILIRKDFNIIDIRAYTVFYKLKEFMELKKQDRDIMLRVLFKDFYIFEDNLINIIKIIENSVRFIEKLEFNLKSCIGALNGIE